ncbi:hypothetical protein Lal_00019013 [Lupinus albus]|uniref:Uncharacterized protein n=1 Tax=Lupinus albus TaxID=3870 RepID=A0A6A4R4G7_LUPAL|nr:hypothetical protein Lalb_Chr01g0008401 [Lupinus albus]KAF1898892.1 hypothetical protein Lal_00019013 [Lupinus albus]
MDPKKSVGLMANVMNQKESFIQLLAMTAILCLSVKCLSHKHRIVELEQETRALDQKHVSLTRRMKRTKRELLREASLDSSGLFASRLRLLFARRR